MTAAAIGAVGPLSPAQVEAVLTAAAAAPSNHNTQPWRFRCLPDAIELHGDPSRALPAADPEHRELRLACGAALLNMRLAIAALGRQPLVELHAESSDPWRLAVVTIGTAMSASAAEVALARVIHGRRTNRRPFVDAPIQPSFVASLRAAATAEQAVLVVVQESAQLERLGAIVHAAQRIQEDDPAFQQEWAQWVGRSDGHLDGVPISSAGPAPEPHDRWVLRDFATGAGRRRVAGKDFESEPLLAVLCSHHDLPLGQVQAGQAMERVLLTATTHGLAVSFLSQPVEVATKRGELRTLLGGRLWPQIVLRIGYGSPTPPTPRRPPAELLLLD